MRCALIGTRGVPARYGGFETAVEEVGRRLAARGHDVLVFCRRATGEEPSREYLGMRRIVLPSLQQRALETPSHTALSVVHPELRGVGSAIMFNAANAPLLPALRARRIPVATHVDGLEWKRAKWGPVGQRYYRLAEGLAVRWSDALIADARGIAEYYASEYGAPTRQIAYGAPIIRHHRTDKLTELSLLPRGFHLVVARFEPENHVLEIVRGYTASSARLPLVVVGGAPYSDGYISEIRRAADARVRFLGGVWDQELLDQLYANALSYVHGHSVGGTNPSLLRAAGAGAPVIAFDVAFNREVIGGDGRYFANQPELVLALEQAEADPVGFERLGSDLQTAIARYDWDDVATEYERLLADLAERGPLPRSERHWRRRAEG